MNVLEYLKEYDGPDGLDWYFRMHRVDDIIVDIEEWDELQLLDRDKRQFQPVLDDQPKTYVGDEEEDPGRRRTTETSVQTEADTTAYSRGVTDPEYKFSDGFVSGLLLQVSFSFGTLSTIILSICFIIVSRVLTFITYT